MSWEYATIIFLNPVGSIVYTESVPGGAGPLDEASRVPNAGTFWALGGPPGGLQAGGPSAIELASRSNFRQARNVIR